MRSGLEGAGGSAVNVSWCMYELSVEREFCAAHAIVIGGIREPVHGHNFRVTVTVAGEKLDADGLLVDFHALERVVDGVVEPLKNVDLGASAAFARMNPTAEVIARQIGRAVSDRLGGVAGAEGVKLQGVRVTEAPGCSVTYRP